MYIEGNHGGERQEGEKSMLIKGVGPRFLQFRTRVVQHRSRIYQRQAGNWRRCWYHTCSSYCEPFWCILCHPNRPTSLRERSVEWENYLCTILTCSWRCNILVYLSRDHWPHHSQQLRHHDLILLMNKLDLNKLLKRKENSFRDRYRCKAIWM